MANLNKLIDSIATSYDKYSHGIYEKNRRDNKATYCNMFIHELCSFFEYKKFKGKLANQICDIIMKDSLWIDSKKQSGHISMEVAQNLANEGKLIIAYYKKEPHGHCCIIRPGQMEYSSKWNMFVPKCVSIGKNNYIGRGINWVFGKNKPYFAYYIPSV